MLEISNLKVGYNGKAVASVSAFRLPPGEHGLILGPSGCGKTTLLYTIAGLLEPIEGNIPLGGIDIASLNGAEADRFRGKNIGIIYQTLHMIPALTAMENLMVAQYAAGLPHDTKKPLQWLSRLGLGDKRHVKPHELSQGQQQRLSVARAAINDPVLILGDEPTSALDDASCKTTIELLFEAAAVSGASLLVATHDHRIKPYFKHSISL